MGSKFLVSTGLRFDSPSVAVFSDITKAEIQRPPKPTICSQDRGHLVLESAK